MKCNICNRECNGFYSLSFHLRRGHGIKPKDYYDNFIKKDSEGSCKSCNNKTTYIARRIQKNGKRKYLQLKGLKK